MSFLPPHSALLSFKEVYRILLQIVAQFARRLVRLKNVPCSPQYRLDMLRATEMTTTLEVI